MPVKDIYIKKNMKGINDLCNYDYQRDKSMKCHINNANKAFSAATKAYNDQDEERAYILFMRFLDAFKKMRKTTDFKKDSDYYMGMIGKPNVHKAMDNAEELCKSLEYRYQELEAKLLINKKNSERKSSESNDIVPTMPMFNYPTDKLDNAELYKLLIKEKKNVILMDIRSVEDYNNSHIQHGTCINVPSKYIKPGTLSSKIEDGISENDYGIWSTRDSVDLIILLDWHSSLSRLEDKKDPLRSLKDSIFKWEQKKKLQREPVILEGGYADFLDSYPQFTTNPSVKPPREKRKTGNVNSLLEFSYDNLKEQLHPKPSKTSSDESEDAGYSSSPVTTSYSEVTETKESPEHTSTDPSSSILKLNGDSHAAGLYPNISSIINKPQTTKNITPVPVIDKPDKPTNSIKYSDKAVVRKPTIDRSVKPTSKPEPKIMPSEPKTQESHVKVKQIPQIPDRPAKNVSPTIIAEEEKEEDPFEVMQKKMEGMRLEAEEKRKKLVEIEKKKRFVELETQMKKMESENAELERKKIEAEKNLANTMRVSKPKASEYLDKQVPAKPVDPAPSVTMNLDNNKFDKAPEIASQVLDTPTISTSAKPAQNSPIKPVVTKPTKPSSSSKPAANEENSADTTVISDNVIPKTGPMNQPSPNSSTKNGHEMKSLKPPIKLAEVKPVVKKPLYDNSAKPVENITPKIIPNNHIKPSDMYATVQKPQKLVKDVAEKPSNVIRSSRSIISTKPQSPVHQSFGGGLKRSRSSPNINKLVDEEMNVALIPSKTKPVPSRASKPPDIEQPTDLAKHFRNSLQGIHGSVGPALTGLRNLGNTCYMNSVLQCLFNTTQLAEYVLTNRYRRHINNQNKLGYGGRIAECFAVLLREIWSGNWSYLVPSDFKSMIGSFNSTFSGYSQEDSQEFLLFLLDGLHEDLNKTSLKKYTEEPDNSKFSDEEAASVAWKFHLEHNDSIILGLFKGQFKGIIQCLTCRVISRKFDVFMYLSLPLPQKSTNIHSVIKSFSATEKMEGSNQWDCPKCKRKRDAVRKIEIWKLPPVLIVHFKRFECSGQWRDKIHTNVSYPLTNLDINEFSVNKKVKRKYDLYAVSHHQGAGLDSGHYVATCKNVVDNSWYRFDDTEVTRTSEPKSSTAFLLFYSSLKRIKPMQAPFDGAI